jgi:hypothetical protein
MKYISSFPTSGHHLSHIPHCRTGFVSIPSQNASSSTSQTPLNALHAATLNRLPFAPPFSLNVSLSFIQPRTSSSVISRSKMVREERREMRMRPGRKGAVGVEAGVSQRRSDTEQGEEQQEVVDEERIGADAGGRKRMLEMLVSVMSEKEGDEG